MIINGEHCYLSQIEISTHCLEESLYEISQAPSVPRTALQINYNQQAQEKGWCNVQAR